MNTIALWIGYAAMSLFCLYVAWELFAWLVWPLWSILAELRFMAHKYGVRSLLSWGVARRFPRCYLYHLKDYWTFFGGYCDGLISWDCATWHKPLHPFSPGRMVFRERPLPSNPGDQRAGEETSHGK